MREKCSRNFLDYFLASPPISLFHTSNREFVLLIVAPSEIKFSFWIQILALFLWRVQS